LHRRVRGSPPQERSDSQTRGRAATPDSRRIFAVANNAIDAFGLVVECQISD
jgi:hypothetical protein